MERQKILERDEFTFDERYHIYHKSDGKCVHCGKKIEFGGEATVEHFVPLSKGGTNRDINMVMSCKKCNDDKGNKIVSPNWCRFLNKKHKDKLMDYFDSYVQSFEYMSRNNLLACDEYEVSFYPEAARKLVSGKNKNEKLLQKLAVKYNLARVIDDETFESVQDFFVEYLRKYGILYDEATARKNMEFWRKFGAIYIIEKDKEIKLAAPVLLADLDGHKAYGLSIFIFSIYAHNVSKNLVYAMSQDIPEYLLGEQDIGECKVNVSIPEGDPTASLLQYIGGPGGVYNAGLFNTASYRVGKFKGKTEEEIAEQEIRAEKYFRHFMVKKEDVDAYCNANENEDIEWMKTLIYPIVDFTPTKDVNCVIENAQEDARKMMGKG